MSSRIVIAALLSFVALPALAQVAPAANGASASPDEDLRMSVPPPVSGMDFALITGAEDRSNMLRGSLAVDAAYIDNAFSGEFTRPLHETTITIRPNISFDRTTPRDRESLSYTPGFTLYQPTSDLNAIDQSAQARIDYRFARYTALSVSNLFVQTTNMFGQSGAIISSGVSASGDSPLLLIPFASQISDTLHATFSHQYARNQMFGAGGSFGIVHFPNPSQAPGLYDSKSGSGSAFYAFRAGERHYLGFAYQFTRIAASPTAGESNTDVQSFVPYYTFYIGPTISVSIAAGPQYFKATETGFADFTGWAPYANASVARQTAHTNLALSYAHTVSGGSGLLGAFKQDSVNFTSRAQFSRAWAAGAEGGYTNNANATPNLGSSFLDGHRISGKGLIQRTFGEHFVIEAGYERLHQAYPGLALLNNNPDSNRGYASITCQFARPIGR
ncbi:MAG TPA: hypothetical protein VN151_07840 [Terracidiphilus sp.]|nr:hypothetical protein [Terracidiphilus sp.]